MEQTQYVTLLQLLDASFPGHFQKSQPERQPFLPRPWSLRCCSVAASIAPDIDACSVPAAGPLVIRMSLPLCSLRSGWAGMISAV